MIPDDDDDDPIMSTAVHRISDDDDDDPILSTVVQRITDDDEITLHTARWIYAASWMVMCMLDIIVMLMCTLATRWISEN